MIGPLAVRDRQAPTRAADPRAARTRRRARVAMSDVIIGAEETARVAVFESMRHAQHWLPQSQQSSPVFTLHLLDSAISLPYGFPLETLQSTSRRGGVR